MSNIDKGTKKKVKKNSKRVFSVKSRGILFTLIVIFLILILTPAVIIGFMSITTASDSLIENAKKQNERSSMQASLYFDLILEKAEYLSTQLFTNNSVQKYGMDIDKKADSRTLTMDKQDVLNTVNNLNSASSDLNVAILYENGELIGGMSMSNLDMEKIRASNWYKNAIGANGKPIWTDLDGNITQELTDDYAVTLVRTINSAVTAKPIGVMLIFMSYDAFTNSLKNLNIGKNDSAYLITNYGKVISPAGKDEAKDLSQKPFVKQILSEIKKQNKGSFYANENRKDFLTVFNKSDRYGWTTVILTSKDEITKQASALKIKIIIVGIILSILAIIIAILFSLRISRNITKIMRAMEMAENGNLMVRLNIKSKDEIGVLAEKFNLMIDKIKELVTKSKESAAQVLQSSNDVSAIATDSAKSSEDVANVMSDIASGCGLQVVEVKKGFEIASHLSGKINLAVKSIADMEEQSRSVEMMTSRGIEIVNNLNQRNKETMDITDRVISEVNNLNENVNNIGMITNILKEIAKETKLLALNAAIEAGRTGQAGKGFAVVASEIKKLAEQSDKFTKEIQSFIMKIMEQTRTTVELASEADIIVKNQSQIVEDTAQIFEQIYNSISSLIQNVRNVSIYAKDIDELKNEMLGGMNKISISAEEVASSTEEVSAAAEEQSALNSELEKTAQKLNTLALSLMSTIEIFKIEQENI